MKARLFYAALAAFALAHQDVWLWDNASLLLGFLPAGLAYHAAYSLLTAGMWVLAIRYAWPPAVEAAESAPDDGGGGPR